MDEMSFSKIDYKAVGVLKVCGVQKVDLLGQRLVCPAERCHMLFESIVRLKSHFVSEHNKKPFVCNEINCTWAFPTLSKLERHKLIHQNDKKPFKCDVNGCGKLFSTRSNLKHHTKNYHQTPPKFLCSIENCSAGFHNQKTLDIHISEHSDASPNYRCSAEGCNKEFFTLSALHFHAHRHNCNEDELRCKECGKTYTVPRRLQTHMMSHSVEKAFLCRVPACNWSFNTRTRLNRHMDSHRSNRKYQCTFPECGKAFLRREHLQDHAVVHTRPRKETKTKQVRSPLRGNTSLEGEKLAEKSKVSPDVSSVVLMGSARTSLTYSDIVVEKETRSNLTAVAEPTTPARPVTALCDTNSSCLSEVLRNFDMSPVVSFCDPGQFTIQDDLLSQVLHLDSTAPLSELEPSTVNLRDLE